MFDVEKYYIYDDANEGILGFTIGTGLISLGALAAKVFSNNKWNKLLSSKDPTNNDRVLQEVMRSLNKLPSELSRRGYEIEYCTIDTSYKKLKSVYGSVRNQLVTLCTEIYKLYIQDPDDYMDTPNYKSLLGKIEQVSSKIPDFNKDYMGKETVTVEGSANISNVIKEITKTLDFVSTASIYSDAFTKVQNLIPRDRDYEFDECSGPFHDEGILGHTKWSQFEDLWFSSFIKVKLKKS